MIVECPDCHTVYDDAKCWTICPHPTLDGPPPGQVDASGHFKHDCDCCVYLGAFDEHDLYYCTQGGLIPTIIARFGDKGPHYISGMSFVDVNKHITEGFKRATSLGLFPQDKKGPSPASCLVLDTLADECRRRRCWIKSGDLRADVRKAFLGDMEAVLKNASFKIETESLLNAKEQE